VVVMGLVKRKNVNDDIGKYHEAKMLFLNFDFIVELYLQVNKWKN
jgi:hypothetical protein